jgi:single-stranded DNA-binding protein
LQTRPYTGQDGIEKYATEIVLEELVMLDKMPEDVKDTLELKDVSNGAPAQQV